MAARRVLDTRFPDLRSEVAEVQARFPQLADDDCFCAWFIHAYLVESEDQAVGAVTGATRDKGIDAVWIDDNVACS
jgi:hypothetical protein